MKNIPAWLIGLFALTLTGTANCQWATEWDEDPMTDKKRGRVSYVDNSEGKAMNIRCGTAYAEDGLNIIIVWNNYFTEANAFIKFRFDKGTPFTQMVALATSGTAFFIADWKEQDFLENMKASGKLTIQATPFQKGTQTWVIDLTGFTVAFYQHCAGLSGR